MRDRKWTEAVLRQLWAEGIDLLELGQSTGCQDQLDELSKDLPNALQRHRAHYPRPTGLWTGTQFVAVHVERIQLVQWFDRMWGGICLGLSTLHASWDAETVDQIAHWRLNLLIGRAALSLTSQEFVLMWTKHQSWVQGTPAERSILEWYVANQPWWSRWHPEGSGALRRAPLWGAIFAGSPKQAAVAAANDARVAYGGWGIWVPMVVAYATAQLWNGTGPPTDVLIAAMTQVDRGRPDADRLTDLIRGQFPGSSWNDWVRAINDEFVWFPTDHSLPNLLLTLGAMHWFGNNLESMWASLIDAGWDSITNVVLSGALCGTPREAVAPSMRPPFIQELVNTTVKRHYQ